jgi:hypothetical protein
VSPTISPSTSPVKPEKYNKYKHQGGHEHVVLFCDALDQHGDKPKTVLRRAGLDDADWNEPDAVTALFMTARNTSLTRSPVTLTMTMTLPMTLPSPRNRMIAPEYPSCLWGVYRVI